MKTLSLSWDREAFVETGGGHSQTGILCEHLSVSRETGGVRDAFKVTMKTAVVLISGKARGIDWVETLDLSNKETWSYCRLFLLFPSAA